MRKHTARRKRCKRARTQRACGKRRHFVRWFHVHVHMHASELILVRELVLVRDLVHVRELVLVRERGFHV